MSDAAAPLVVVMGVSGCGKSTVGGLLAQRLRAEFLEGDSLHPARNVERMAAGVALTDDDRRDWLLAVANHLRSAMTANQPLVVSCSALRRSYRDLLRRAAPDVAFVHVHGDPALLAQRMNARVGHYMPASLLASQLKALEAPEADEHAITFDTSLAPEQIAARAAAWLVAPAPGKGAPS
jgi:carbohydrate kinase (thermoresistant glucokinase family)